MAIGLVYLDSAFKSVFTGFARYICVGQRKDSDAPDENAPYIYVNQT